MDKSLKNMVIGLFVIVAIVLAGYAIYRVYNYAVEDATKRIKQGVTEGVSEGIGEGVGGALNPLSLPGKIFGHGK